MYKYGNNTELIIVPESMQKEIFREIHNKDHYAVSKSEAIIKHDYYLPNLWKQIKRAIRNCVECIIFKRKWGKDEGEGLLKPIPKQDSLF